VEINDATDKELMSIRVSSAENDDIDVPLLRPLPRL
jgi:hypothetical protein